MRCGARTVARREAASRVDWGSGTRRSATINILKALQESTRSNQRGIPAFTSRERVGPAVADGATREKPVNISNRSAPPAVLRTLGRIYGRDVEDRFCSHKSNASSFTLDVASCCSTLTRGTHSVRAPEPYDRPQNSSSIAAMLRGAAATHLRRHIITQKRRIATPEAIRAVAVDPSGSLTRPEPSTSRRCGRRRARRCATC